MSVAGVTESLDFVHPSEAELCGSRRFMATIGAELRPGGARRCRYLVWTGHTGLTQQHGFARRHGIHRTRLGLRLRGA